MMLIENVIPINFKLFDPTWWQPFIESLRTICTTDKLKIRNRSITWYAIIHYHRLSSNLTDVRVTKPGCDGPDVVRRYVEAGIHVTLPIGRGSETCQRGV
jgi:hypothetical protein